MCANLPSVQYPDQLFYEAAARIRPAGNARAESQERRNKHTQDLNLERRRTLINFV
jgi:hypothetical protein